MCDSRLTAEYTSLRPSTSLPKVQKPGLVCRVGPLVRGRGGACTPLTNDIQWDKDGYTVWFSIPILTDYTQELVQDGE